MTTRRLGDFEQLLLFAILRLEDDAYGVAIRRELQERANRSVSAGAVYTALERLESKGLVTSRVGDTAPARGGRRRKYYSLVPAGAEALRRSYDEIRRMADGVAGRLAVLASGGE
jgi:DNA-binding PadR family transcriptional regulator